MQDPQDPSSTQQQQQQPASAAAQAPPQSQQHQEEGAPPAPPFAGAKDKDGKEISLTDQEIAWRLHQELNAASPLFRTRSRRTDKDEKEEKPACGEKAVAGKKEKETGNKVGFILVSLFSYLKRQYYLLDE